MTPPPISSTPRQSLLGLVSLAIALLGGALRAWVAFTAGSVSWATIAALILGLLLVVIGAVLGLSALALRGVRRETPAAAAFLNAALVAAFLIAAAQIIPPYLRSLGEEAKAVNGAVQAINEGVVPASKTIPQKPGAVTLKDVWPIYERWARQNMDAAYDAHGQKDPRWDADAHLMIAGAMLARVGTPDAPAASERRELSRKILAAGCEDPLMLFLAGELTQSYDGQASLLQRAAEGLPARGYPPALLFLARTALFNLPAPQSAPAPRVSSAACLEALHAALTEKPLTADDCYVWNFLLGLPPSVNLLNRDGEKECTMIEAIPGFEEWLKHRLRGSYETELAWNARGKGWANSVTDKGEQGFEEHLAKAERELTRAWELNPGNPSAATEMIRVTMGSSGAEEMRTWFDRAVEARFDYRNAYHAMRWGLRTRWNGSEAAMLAFGRACAETRRYETPVPWELLLAVKDQASDWDAPDTYYPSRAPWAELRSMFEGYLHEPAQAGARAYYLSEYAIVAAKCRKMPECLQQLDALHDKLDLRAAEEWQLDPVRSPASLRAQAARSRGAQPPPAPVPPKP